MTTTLSRFLRMALAAALVAVASGVPQALYVAVAVSDCCGDSERDGGGCPPGCPSPSCAKVFAQAVPQARAEASPAPIALELRPVALDAPALPHVGDGVFHPPRA